MDHLRSQKCVLLRDGGALPHRVVSAGGIADQSTYKGGKCLRPFRKGLLLHSGKRISMVARSRTHRGHHPVQEKGAKVQKGNTKRDVTGSTYRSLPRGGKMRTFEGGVAIPRNTLEEGGAYSQKRSEYEG